MSQFEFAQRVGMATKAINEIIKAKAPITLDSALKFAFVLKQPARYWLNLESIYQQFLARRREQQNLEGYVDWLEKIPLAAMVKVGWIEKLKGKVDQLRSVLDFFGIVSPDQWHTL